MSTEKDQARIQEIIREITGKSTHDNYNIYRGEPEDYCKVSSNLYRQYEAFFENFDIELVQKEILVEIRKEHTQYTHQYDIEILSELQHYGGKTNLIDFTTDYLIALFYACDSSPNKNGRIVFTKNLDDENKHIRKPWSPVNRVIAQKSIFVEPKKGFIEPDAKIYIPQDLKQPILEYLEEHHGISRKTIYNDLHGYIKYQAIHQEANKQFYFGLICQSQNNLEGAIQHYTKALELKPNFPQAYNNRGLAYDDKGDFGPAIKDYTKAIKQKLDFAEAYNNRGSAYAHKGDLDRAIQDYDKALELEPNFAETYNNRGNAYARKGDLDRAIQDYDKAIELKRNLAEAYNNRGGAYARKGDLDRAIQDYDKALKRKPDYAEAYNNRGLAYASKGDLDRAIQDYDKALELEPNFAETYNNRGLAYASKGDLDRAIQDYDKALELEPNFAGAYYNRGLAYASKGDFDRAIQDYDKTLELKPDDAEAYYNRGVAWLCLKSWEKARADLTSARNMGADIVALFQQDYKGVASFEQRYNCKLPVDLTAMLTPKDENSV